MTILPCFCTYSCLLYQIQTKLLILQQTKYNREYNIINSDFSCCHPFLLSYALYCAHYILLSSSAILFFLALTQFSYLAETLVLTVIILRDL